MKRRTLSVSNLWAVMTKSPFPRSRACQGETPLPVTGPDVNVATCDSCPRGESESSFERFLAPSPFFHSMHDVYSSKGRS